MTEEQLQTYCKINYSQSTIKYTEEKDIEYYGGYLICESISNDKVAQLISAAPQLLKCLKDAIQSLEYERNKAPKEWYEVVELAEGLLA
jgi:hypothetical protein